jgi:hypothetical protein
MSHVEKVIKHYKGRVGLAEKFLLALRLLLAKYEREDYSALCSLCSINTSCEDCPWHVLIHSNCDYMYHIVRSGRRKNRMKQIERWIKAYEEALKELKT